MGNIELTRGGKPEIAAAIGYSAEALYRKCQDLAGNLWWSWHHNVIAIFNDLDPIAWVSWTTTPSLCWLDSRRNVWKRGRRRWSCTAASTMPTAA